MVSKGSIPFSWLQKCRSSLAAAAAAAAATIFKIQITHTVQNTGSAAGIMVDSSKNYNTGLL
jgi:hypothetical protein